MKLEAGLEIGPVPQRTLQQRIPVAMNGRPVSAIWSIEPVKTALKADIGSWKSNRDVHHFLCFRVATQQLCIVLTRRRSSAGVLTI